MAFLHLIGPLLFGSAALANGAVASGQSATPHGAALARDAAALGQGPTPNDAAFLGGALAVSNPASAFALALPRKNHSQVFAPAAAKPRPSQAPTHLGQPSRTAAPKLQRSFERQQKSRLARWLSRPLSPHPEFLNHGEVSPFVDVGLPFGYRLGFKIGLLDVLTVGLLAQWRDPALGLRIAPEVGLALYRGRHLALGLRYRYLFHPLPPAPLSPEEEFDQKAKQAEQGPSADPSKPQANPAETAAAALPQARFFPRTHYGAGSIVWSSGYLSAGMEAGLSYRRELDQGQEILDPNLFRMQWRPMTGVLLRFGDPQWGVVLQAMIPSPELTLRFEWRYSLFAPQKSREPLSRALQRARQRERALRAAQSRGR